MSRQDHTGIESDRARAQTSEFWIKAGRVAVLGVAILAAASPASAEDAKTRAQKLFQQGVEAMEKGDSAAGCTKLRESLGLFAVANTLFLVAQCDEQDGKLGTALAHWKRGLALVDAKDKRVPMAKERIAALESKVPRVHVVVPGGQTSMTVLLDGEEIKPSALEAPLPVDAGKHVLVFRVPGRQDHSHEIVLAPGERTEVVATVGPLVEETNGPPKTNGSGLRTGGFVALGVGGAALVAAGITGGIALGRRSDAIKNCPEVGGVPTCPASYEEQLSKDKSLVIGNTVAWGIGIAGVATGAVLLVLSTRGSAKHSGLIPVPLVLTGGGGVGLIGEL